MRRALGRIVLSVIALAAAVAAAEVFLQLYRPIRIHRITSELYQACEDPVLLYEPKALIYDQNSDTLRGREVGVDKPPSVYRIVIAGDSLVYGVNVDGDKTYSARLEQMLNDHAAPGRRFEVLNLGCSGYRIAQVVARIKKRGLKYNPDLIIYGYWLDDVVDSNDDTQQQLIAEVRAAQQDSRGLLFNSPEMRGWWRGLMLRTQIARRIIAMSRARKRRATPQPVTTRPAMNADLGDSVAHIYQTFCSNVADGTFADLKGAVNNRSFEPYYLCYTRYDDFVAWNRALHELRTLADEAGSKLLLSMTPVIYDAPGGHYAWTGVHDLVRDVAAVYDIPVFDDVRKTFARYPAAETGLGDTEHPNAFGHELIAGALFGYLSNHQAEYGVTLRQENINPEKGGP